MAVPCVVTAQDLPGSKEEVAKFVRYNSKTVVLEDVRVIDGTGSVPREHQAIVISNGRITFIGNSPPASLPKDATRLRFEGRTVMPGLVMLHEHMFYFSGFRVWHSQAVSYPRLYLAAGVTTLRTAGTDVPYTDLNLKLAIDEGRIAGPKMFVTGPFFNSYEGHFLGDNIVRTEADARRSVAYWAGEGVTSFKVYANISLDALKGVVAEARARGLKVTGHLDSVSCRDAATLGIDNVYEKGIAVGPFGKSYLENDIFGIAVEELNSVPAVRYYLNSKCVYESFSRPNFPLRGAVCLREEGASVSESKIAGRWVT